MSSNTIISINDIISLPNDVMTLCDDKFFNLICNLGGETVSELFKIQSINTTRTLLRMNNVFSFLDLDCPELDELKQKVRFNLTNGTTLIKPGVANNVDYIFTLLRSKEQQLKEKEKNIDYEKDVLYKLIEDNPLLKSLMLWYQKNEKSSFTQKQTLLATFIDNITNNLRDYSQ